MSENELIASLILIFCTGVILYPLIKLYKTTDKDLENLRSKS
jgi:hypothetical protein